MTPATKTRDDADARNKTEAVRLLYAAANPQFVAGKL